MDRLRTAARIRERYGDRAWARLRATVDRVLEPLRRYRMHAYYVATMAVGLLGVVGSQWGWTYGVGMTVVGALLLRARLADLAHREAALMRILTWLVVVQVFAFTEHGVVLGELALVLRLLAGPLQMTDWARYREQDEALASLVRERQS